MRKSVVFALLLLISAAWLWAQQGNPPSDTGKASGPTTIEGCLQSAAGVYSLTDSSGKKIRLVGYAGKKIDEHIGHTVEITGTPTVKTSDTTQQGGASTARETPVFKVGGIKHIADTCKAM